MYVRVAVLFEISMLGMSSSVLCVRFWGVDKFVVGKVRQNLKPFFVKRWALALVKRWSVTSVKR